MTAENILHCSHYFLNSVLSEVVVDLYIKPKFSTLERKVYFTC